MLAWNPNYARKLRDKQRCLMSPDHLSRILSRLGLRILKSIATAYKSISGSVYEVESKIMVSISFISDTNFSQIELLWPLSDLSHLKHLIKIKKQESEKKLEHITKNQERL